jgi:hypothetical protein
MFDPTTRLQSARMHRHDLHHAARHVTPHAADHALRRATDRSLRRAADGTLRRLSGGTIGQATGDAAPRPTRLLVPVQDTGARRSPGRLASLLTSLGSGSRRPAPPAPVPAPPAPVPVPANVGGLTDIDRQSA